MHSFYGHRIGGWSDTTQLSEHWRSRVWTHQPPNSTEQNLFSKSVKDIFLEKVIFHRRPNSLTIRLDNFFWRTYFLVLTSRLFSWKSPIDSFPPCALLWTQSHNRWSVRRTKPAYLGFCATSSASWKSKCSWKSQHWSILHCNQRKSIDVTQPSFSCQNNWGEEWLRELQF